MITDIGDDDDNETSCLVCASQHFEPWARPGSSIARTTRQLRTSWFRDRGHLHRQRHQWVNRRAERGHADGRTSGVATRRGWQLVEEYVACGVSGSKESRPALNRLMKDGLQRRFDVV